MSAKDGFVFVTDPEGEAARRYKQIVDEILGRAWPRKRMLVTSPAPGEGKTVTSVNIALALAAKGHSVFLAELTLMRPRYRFVFGAPPTLRGVESVLRGEATPEEVTFLLGETGVAVTSVGAPMPDNELLNKRASLHKLIAFGESKCEWVILDVPSIEESPAVKELASQAGPVVMVARSYKTKLAVFRKATNTLGSDLDYVILNDIAS
ncbi:Tyrosine-protein kinase EpsD [Acidisarcina polymorpha]|uniref:Tyrosine-protein kinase EpsD n=2 Tax=Acidisarcina polymorpha TaxID=2211140 RepID=A0A2Z5FZH4_9BACT|nr:Tyrosine-protein kinase EpsD [Acidisarcina polymorpha]